MSEVSDATQIIMMTARGGYILGKIGIAAAAKAIWKFRGGADQLRMRADTEPNPLVYDLTCRELGI